MPNEVRDFSEIFSELNVLIEKSVNDVGVSYEPTDVLTWFNRADVWRKPDRGNALLNLAKRIGLNVSALVSAMQNSQSLNTAEIIEGVPADQRSNGERIRSAVDAARLLAITAAVSI